MPSKTTCVVVTVVAVRLAPLVLAGGGPQNVLVVVNDQSIESLELGQYYQEQRGIPERNVCHVSVDPALHNMSWDSFRTSVVEKIHQHIAAYGLASQIDYLVLGRGIPSRVNENEGATAVLFYGFKNAPSINPPSLPCSMPTNTVSHYYKAERAFRHADTYGGTNYYLAMLLTARTLAQGRTNVNLNVLADASAPPGTYYLRAPPGDPARNVRYKLFDNFDFHARFFTNFPARDIASYNEVYNKNDLLSYLSGAPTYPTHVTNSFRPGAIGDLFTSFGGRLPDGYGHSTVWTWFEKGASASYGTVAEPCAYLAKFPDPLVCFWQARGFNNAESYWMSVRNPYQGVFAGDPLAAPFAFPPSVQITNLLSNQVVSGVVDVGIFATTNSRGQFCNSLDIYVDDLWVTNVVTVGPTLGNVLYAVLGGVTCTYTAVSGDTLYDAVAGLAYSINASNLPVWAYAYGDRILLVYTNYGQPGGHIACEAGTAIGSASELTVWGEALTTNLMETVYQAREFIQLTGTANTGDLVRCVITLTNGTVVTNSVVAGQGESAASVMNRLCQVINSNAILQATNGVFANMHSSSPYRIASLDAREPGPQGYNLFVDYAVIPVPPFTGLSASDSFSDNFNDNKEDLTARGNLLFWCGRNPLTGTFSWDTTSWDDGPHTIRAVAKLGNATEVQGHYVLPVLVSNSSLSCVVSAPTNDETFLLGDLVEVTAVATNPAAAVTQVVFLVEEKVADSDLSAPFSTSWDTMGYGVGTVSVRARAFDEAGHIAISPPVQVRILMSPTLDTDGDGVADVWEQRFFGGLDVYGASDDPDGDGANNYHEYVSDTDPTEGTDFFAVDIERGADETIDLTFLSSTARLYDVWFNDGFLTNCGLWQTASPTSFWGVGSLQVWTDDGTQTGTHPSSVLHRVYRLRVHLP